MIGGSNGRVRAVTAMLSTGVFLLGVAGCVMSAGDHPSNNNGNGNFSGDDAIQAALRIDPDVDHVLGDISAPNKIIEYGNFECSHCAGFHIDTYPAIKDLVDQGRVVFVFRHIAPSNGALVDSAAAECAARQDPDQFYPFHDLIFENFPDVDATRLGDFADELGLDRDALSACIPDPDVYDRIVRDSDSAQILGVTGTPTFYVNGQMLVGEQPIAEFENLLQ